MNKIVITVLLGAGFCIFAELRAQERFPSREQIEAVAADTTQYDSLLERFLGGEEELSPQEYIYLYYGFAMRDSFRGFTGYEAAVNGIQDLIKKRNFGEAKTKCEKLIADFPVSPTAWFLCYMVAARSGEPPQVWQKYYRKMTSMSDAILASGDGKTRETAFKVITQSDEYRVMYSLEITKLKNGREKRGEMVLFRVYPSERFAAEELWFDKSMAMIKLPE